MYPNRYVLLRCPDDDISIDSIFFFAGVTVGQCPERETDTLRHCSIEPLVRNCRLKAELYEISFPRNFPVTSLTCGRQARNVSPTFVANFRVTC